MTGPHVSAISTSSALLAGGGKISKKLANIERDENPPYEPQLCSNDDFWDTLKQYEHNHGLPASSHAQLKPRVWQVTQSSDKEVPPKLKRGVAERVRKATCQECGAS